MGTDNFIPDSSRYDKMKFNRSGNSGILLPQISLGLWQNFGSSDPFERSRDVLYYAFNNGVIHFDLANNYGPPNGSAEVTFGKVMNRSFHTHRHELFISTKAGYQMWDGPYGNWGSRKSLMNSIDQSLKRMNLDYVDLFYSHRYDPETPIEETLQALVDIVHQGKALYVGLSRYPADATRFALDYLRERDVPCLIYQGKYNLLKRDPEEEILPLCYYWGTGFIGFSPLEQGLLTSRYINGIPKDSRMAKERFLKSRILTKDLHNKILRLNDYAEKRGLSLAQLSLLWVLSHKEVTSVIVGASSVAQLADNLKVINLEKLTEEEIDNVSKIL